MVAQQIDRANIAPWPSAIESPVLPGRLYVGGDPDDTVPDDVQSGWPRVLALYSLVVSCTDIRPPQAPGVIHFPMLDEPWYWRRDPRGRHRVLTLADVIARHIESGGSVLVHCHAGLNRSGVIAGVALVRLGYTPSEAIQLVRGARGEQALSNPTFASFIRSL